MMVITKPKTCRVCGCSFTPRQPMAKVCGLDCAKTLAVSIRVKSEKVAQVKERRADKVKREKLKTKGEWTREAQTAFNAFIRTRDAGKPCICCGRTGAGEMHGGEWDAGHYRSRGAAPHLRFDERNVHAQLKQCNRYASGNIVGYRAGLIERIGLEAVEALEADQAPRHYSIEELRAIKAHYASMARVLKKRAAHV